MKNAIAVLMMVFAAPAFAQDAPPAAAPSQTMSLEQFMQQNLTPEKQQKLKRAMVGAVLVQCVGAKSGMQPAQDFYQQVQTVGKQVNADCKSGQADSARVLVLSTIDAHKQDPLVGDLHNCYVQHTGDVALLDTQGQTDAAKYDRWIRDPETAHREMTDADVCHPPKGTANAL
ncbi:MAG: hypothetical protein WDN72_03020 [Alphaproteobacteria bacterium]